MEALIVVLLLALLGVGGAIVWLLAQQQRRPEVDAQADAQTAALRELAQSVAATRESVAATQSSVAESQRTLLGQINAVDSKVNQRLDAVQNNIDRSLTSTGETIGKIGEQLGALGESARRIMEVGKDVSSLKEVLQPPKLRGNFGEMLLGQLVRQVLPASYYAEQHRFSDGTIVDLVIRTPDGLVPIDSKFPVDSFRRMLEATTDDERQRQRRVFLREVRTRIDQVAKYIRPEDNTLDFALMYVPAENIYYEAIVGAEDESTMTYALERRVQLVSPNTFHAFLQVVSRGFRGLQVEQNAKEIIARLGQLRNEFGKFRQEFEVLGGHVGRAKNKYDELDKLAGRLGDRLEVPVQARLQFEGSAPALPEPVISNGNEEPAAIE
jgi:DNA recombination protein RmuC